ncbi:MAG: LPS export ABC transporter periplasmic protein LptC [Cellvibrionaceae bacterium]|nr:LPS export ABC transporter periplasmic protein LptC [Cellvibrionaceae bacterium]
MNKNTFYQVFAVVMVGAILYYMDSSQNILGTPETIQKDNDQLPYAVAGSTATQHFSDKGVLDYTFNAKLLRYFNGVDNVIETDNVQSEPGGEYTLLEEPKFVIYLPDRSWRIESLTGIITEQGNIITLEGNVRIWRNDEDESNTQLTTESLTILPHEKFAETEEAVKISSNRGELTAVGMQVSFSDKKIKLLSRVKERHEAL